MTDQAKKARAEYHRKWNHEHPDACKRYHDNYWEKKATQGADTHGNAKADALTD